MYDIWYTPIQQTNDSYKNSLVTAPLNTLHDCQLDGPPAFSDNHQNTMCPPYFTIDYVNVHSVCFYCRLNSTRLEIVGGDIMVFMLVSTLDGDDNDDNNDNV